jgi:hypothetical protein
MRRVALLLGAAFLLSGCAVLTKQELKPTPPTLTQGRFVYLGNRACRRFVRRVTGIPKPKSSPEAARADVEKIFFPAYEHLLFTLRGLAPPPSEAVAYRRLLATFNYEDLVLHHFLQAAEAAQVQRVKTLERRLRRIGRHIDARAAKVGLTTCSNG